MAPGSRPRVVCFSYLAAVTTLRVEAYPSADYGVNVDGVHRFVAGDGPIMAGAAAALDLMPSLVSNTVAEDPDGRYLVSTLESWNVDVSQVVSPCRTETPFSTVVSTRMGTRTWFPYLPGVMDELLAMDLSPLSRADVAYVDCYEVLGSASRGAVRAALSGDGLVILNLGGSPAPPWLAECAKTRRIDAVQTSVAEHQAEEAPRRGADLLAMSSARQVVVTRGRHGAVVVYDGGSVDVKAPPVAVNEVQGAGSVFSAMLAVQLLEGASAPVAAHRACEHASAWCAQPHTFPQGETGRSGNGS